MKALGRDNWFGAVLVTAIAYTVIGFGTAALAGSAHSIQTRTFWRMAAWLLGLITFASHLGYERLRLGNTPLRVARHVATAVALGAFALAVGGPAASHWGEVGFWRVAALSIVLWPILMGIPAFFAALVVASILGRVLAREKPGGSRAAR